MTVIPLLSLFSAHRIGNDSVDALVFLATAVPAATPMGAVKRNGWTPSLLVDAFDLLVTVVH